VTDATEAGALAAECDVYVAEQFEKFAEYLKDPRRQEGFEETSRALFYLKHWLPRATTPKEAKEVAFNIQTNNEQRLRVMGVDLRAAVNASKLITAAAILEYVKACQSELQLAEENLRENYPDEYAKLREAQATKKQPISSPLPGNSSRNTSNSANLPTKPASRSPRSSGSADEPSTATSSG